MRLRLGMPTRHWQMLAAGWCLAALVRGAGAGVLLAPPFGSHMVLQRAAPLPVWGTAAPGELVMVSFAGEQVSATADATGHWRATLSALAASDQGRRLTVTGSETAQPLVLEDVLVGEVWLASGQSNMDFTMSRKVKRFAGVAHEAEEIAAANHPLVRMFTGVAAMAGTPRTTLASGWQVCSPATAPAFSAVAYFFARATGGLVVKGGAVPGGFAIAGADHRFFPATARLDGAAVILSNPAAPSPVAVRYAWENFPQAANLYNQAGLPAPQFRTDDW